MASRRAHHYVRDGRRKSISSLSDDEDPDEEQQSEEDRGGGEVVRLPTLRSMIVRVNSTDEMDDERGDDDDNDNGRDSSLPPPAPALDLDSPALRRDDWDERDEKMYSHANNKSEENRRRVDGDHYNSGPGYGLPMSSQKNAQRNAKGSEGGDGRGDFRSRGGDRDRDREGRRDADYRDGRHDSSNPAGKDLVEGGRGRGRGLPMARLRDLDHDHRDRAVPRRDHHSRSPPALRRQHYSRSPPPRDRIRDVDGKKPYRDRSPDEDEEQRGGRYDDADVDKLHENDARGKGKDLHREGFRRDREGGGRGHPADHNSRRDRDVSPSFRDRREGAGVGSRSPLPVGRNNRGGRNGVDWGRGRDRDDGRDDWRGGRRESDRGRDGGGRGGRGDAGENLVPELYSIHRATVHSIRPFGIFVRLDGYRNHGMVHLTQISNHEVTDRKDSDEEKVKAISSVVGEGEQVWVKVISVQQEDDGGKVKVGCSLKLVSQGDGKDLDPNNLQLEKHQSKGPWQGQKKLELDAVYNVSCTRCGGHGHLKKECYSTGERTYELLEDAENDEGDGAGGSRAGAAASVRSKKLTPAVGPSAKPPSGPAGRGRAMVQPAWMTHGVGVGGDQEKVLGSHSGEGMPKLPEKVTSLEDALAVLEMAKEEKRKRRLERRRRKHRRGDKKHSNREGRKEKPKKRLRNEDDHHHRNKKKRRL
ncbi:unnamed protein product [Calypogeia fissa]